MQIGVKAEQMEMDAETTQNLLKWVIEYPGLRYFETRYLKHEDFYYWKIILIEFAKDKKTGLFGPQQNYVEGSSVNINEAVKIALMKWKESK